MATGFPPNQDQVLAYFDRLKRWRQDAHKQTLAKQALSFAHYRSQHSQFDEKLIPAGTGLDWNFPLLNAAAGDFPQIFLRNLPYWPRKSNRYYRAPDLENAGAGLSLSEHGKKALRRINETKDFFVKGNPAYEYVRPLGHGGNGVIAMYKLRESDGNPEGAKEAIAVKYPLRSWQDYQLKEEIKFTEKLARAKHVVQSLRPEDYGRPPRRPRPPQHPADDDSSDDQQSSGDEDNLVVRPPKRRRVDFTREEFMKRSYKWNPRPPKPGEYSRPGDDEKDFLITELFPSGDLRSVLYRIGQDHIPTKVMWSMFLCMIRMCIGMAFPPRKFHPQRFQVQGELNEEIPQNPLQHRRVKNIVHFDLDPSNIFLDLTSDDAEHNFGPKLRLADFGLAAEIKSQKRDCYYLKFRRRAKWGWFAPEQFTQEWDTIPADRNGSNVCDMTVAGNFGVHTNVWAIGMCMFNVITGYYPPCPPRPGYVYVGAPPPHGRRVVSYGALLQEVEFSANGDRALRHLVARCMAHEPLQRPGLQELKDAAERALAAFAAAGTGDDEHEESTDDVLDWWAALLAPDPKSVPASVPRIA